MAEKEIQTVNQYTNHLQIDKHSINKFTNLYVIPPIKITCKWWFEKDLMKKCIEEDSLKMIKKNLPLLIKSKNITFKNNLSDAKYL